MLQVCFTLLISPVGVFDDQLSEDDRLGDMIFFSYIFYFQPFSIFFPLRPLQRGLHSGKLT